MSSLIAWHDQFRMRCHQRQIVRLFICQQMDQSLASSMRINLKQQFIVTSSAFAATGAKLRSCCSSAGKQMTGCQNTIL